MCHSRAQIVISKSKKSHDTSPSANNLPAQLARSILPVSTEAQPSTQGYNSNGISNEDGVIRVCLESSGSFVGFSFCVLRGLRCGGLGFLRSFFGACLRSFGFVLDALELRRGLDGLLGEVRGDGADGVAINVDQRGG
jgi:hypothetical protein